MKSILWSMCLADGNLFSELAIDTSGNSFRIVCISAGISFLASLPQYSVSPLMPAQTLPILTPLLTQSVVAQGSLYWSCSLRVQVEEASMLLSFPQF